MTRLWDRDLTRTEVLQRVGRLEQVGGVRLVTLGDGIGRGVRVLEFRTATGFSFDVLVDRSFDVGRCELGGRSLAWLANPGVVGPWYYEPEGWGWFRAWGGGMVVTCGLDHTLGPGEDTAEEYHQSHIRKTQTFGLHGRVGGLPARLVGYGERWEGDSCVLWAEGEVLQSTIFGEQLQLRRRIEARLDGSRFMVHDVVDNVGNSRTSHMLLYHCNVGFPVVDEGARLLVPARETTTDYDVTPELMAGYRTLSGPIKDYSEKCFEHAVVAEKDGKVPVAVVNPRLGLGVYQVFDIDQLPHHTVWRMMGEGAYAMAMEPSTNRDAGRWDARERGELLFLEPGETRAYDLEIGALDGATAIDAFERRVLSIDVGQP